MARPNDYCDHSEFLNVDLDVFSRESLAPFVEGLGESFFVLHEGRWGRNYGAILELDMRIFKGKSADRLIRRMVDLLNKMPRPARRLWNRAQIKQFNVGIQGGLKPPVFELVVGPDTLRAVAELGARLVVWVYPVKMAKRKGTPRPKKRSSRPTTG